MREEKTDKKRKVWEVVGERSGERRVKKKKLWEGRERSGEERESEGRYCSNVHDSV